MFRRLFGENAVKDTITVFHKPSLSSSTRIVNLLKQQQANAQNPATEDQASDPKNQNTTQRADFDLDIQEAEPTGDQLKSIIEYAGAGKAGSIVQGATNLSDAMEKVKRDASLFRRPVVVDWHKGKVAVGEDESEILKLLRSIAEEKK